MAKAAYSPNAVLLPFYAPLQGGSGQFINNFAKVLEFVATLLFANMLIVSLFVL